MQGVFFSTSTFLPDGRHFNFRLIDTNIQFRNRYLLRFNQFLYLVGAIPNAGIKLKLSNKFRSIYYPTFHYYYFYLSVLRRMLLALDFQIHRLLTGPTLKSGHYIKDSLKRSAILNFGYDYKT